MDVETIRKAAAGDGSALARIHDYLKQFAADRETLELEKTAIITNGMDYQMSRENMQTWEMMISEMAKQIREEALTNLN